MTQANNPLHGIKLETIVTELVEHYGWEELAERITIRCFTHDPSIKSSLRFLRKTDWAREKVEYLYLKMKKLPLPAPKTAVAPIKAANKSAKPAGRPEAKAASQVNKKPVSNTASDSAEPINSHIWGKRD
ncbi:VF530 family DNA-binding protein [Shewanella acanthi]|uniref:VF530 family protein n=1 Tax=Shewanella acanthi TaxID=2864212 RepID=UPI001C655787|nr:VF530 family protein [Shewanella acanthi]QYJ77665.1 VF530 family protein [Shewanella acanthi]